MSSRFCCKRVDNVHAHDCQNTPKCKCGARLDVQPIYHTPICSKVQVNGLGDQKGNNLLVNRYCQGCGVEAKPGHYLYHKGWC